ELCSLTPKPEKPAWDGVSVASVLLEKGPLKRETLYWHYPHYHPGGATPYGAIRSGDWRLVEFYDDGKVELYNLKEDVGESKDLAASEPEKREELLSLLRKWRREVGAQMPIPNLTCDAERDVQQVAGKAKKPKA